MNKLLAAQAVLLSGLALFLATGGQTFSRVDAGGHRVRMLSLGQGSPTVVFETGAGGPLEVWERVQPQVGKFVRTISYDRAGNGLSEPSRDPRDGLHVAAELHTALHNVHAQPPYLLVGHSLGGLFIRAFASLYPREVAGMLLVDPTQEELLAWNKARKPQPENTRPFRPYDEVDCAPLTFAQVRDSKELPDVPVVLISGMGPRYLPGFLTKAQREESKEDRAVLYPAKLRFHREWVQKLPRGRLFITENSGHGIPLEEPELTVQLIRELVEEITAPAGPAKPR